jgi:eukaryotic-like serine/threonine-protein kinase
MTSPTSKSCPSCGKRYDADVLFCPEDGTPLTNVRGAAHSNTEIDLYIGLDLAGHIRIKHLIGIGSMGRVYRARQGGIERDVAVKILHRELSGNAELVARFHREAKIASRLSHPNVVSVLMTGSIPQKGDARVGGEMYLVMEHLDGISLLSALAAAGGGGVASALPLSRTLHIMMQVCDAVGEAHARGIVHRDIKPENVMLIRRGDDPDFVKVLDFGIARLDWADGSMATQAGLIFGTAKYISPEGAEGKPVTPAADVYSIVTVLYQCLAGRTPFDGESPVQILMQHTQAQPPDLRSISRASYVPEPIAAVIMRNLAKKPEDRASDARVLGKELLTAIRESGLDPEEVTRGGTPSARLGAAKLPSKERTKSLDLSPELATRIGGVSARSADATPLPGSPADPDPVAVEAADSIASSTPGLSADAAPNPTPTNSDSIDEPAPKSPPAPAPTNVVSAEPVVEAPKNELVEVKTSAALVERKQEVEDSPEPSKADQRRTQITRLVAMGFAVLVIVFVVGIGGKRWGIFPASRGVEKQLALAREAIRREAWDSPPGENVKDILDHAQAKWPQPSVWSRPR